MNNDIDYKNLLQELNYFYEVTRSISEKKPLDILLNEIMESCKELMNAEASSLLMYDEKENYLWFEIATGDKGREVKKIKCNMGEGIAGWVAENRVPLKIDDCYQDERFNKEFDIKSKFRTKTMICVPMIHKDKLIGVIQVINKKDNPVFTERDFDMFRLLSSQCAIAIENARLIEVQVQQEVLNRELKTAREIQQNLLPSVLPEYSDLSLSAVLIPAKQVGGDYYNIYKINDDQTLIFVTDVSGKSISASLIVSTICSSVETYFDLKKDDFVLKDFVKCLNRVLIESTTQEKFATSWFGLYFHKESKLVSLNAGHNDIYVFKHDGNVFKLNKGGLFLGFADMEFETEEILIEKDDVVFFYSDGVSEAMSKDFEQYGDERLIGIIQKNRHEDSEIIIKKLIEDIKIFTADAEQSDDITCGAVKKL